MNREILRVEYLSKHQNAQAILRSVSFNICAGQLAALAANLDEKRCLASILSGQEPLDAGRIFIDDRLCTFASPQDAKSAGIYYVGARTQMIPTMTVARNFYLYQSASSRDNFIHDSRLRTQTDTLLAAYGLDRICSTASVDALSNFDRLLLEIIYFSSLGARIIVLDDICESASSANCAELQRILLLLRKRQIAVLFLSNKYDPLFKSFDQLIVVCNGISTTVLRHQEISRANFLLRLSSYSLPTHAMPAPSHGHVLFSMRNIAVSPNPAGETLSFDVFQGEILGLWDVDGKYGVKLGEILSGQASCTGQLYLEGIRLNLLSRKDAVESGIALSSNAYQPDPIYPQMNLCDNVTLLADKIICNRLGFINRRIQQHLTGYSLELIHAKSLVKKYGGKKNLSGISLIDQMRVVIAKWLCVHPKLFVFINPFTSFDDITMREFYQLVQDIRALDISILIISMNQRCLEAACNRVIPLN